MKFHSRRHKPATKEQEAEFRERMSSENVTMKDRFAMLLSAFLVIILPCTLVLIALGMLMLLLFGAFF